MTNIKDKDLYGILDVDQDATEKEILKAYRKKALKCHPDKNPDNPRAVELFHELSDALEILTDGAARAAYDQALKAKKAAQQRHKELDSKRKKFKEDLETREKLYADQQKVQETKITKNLEAEVARLRKEGSRLLEEEQQRLKDELQKDLGSVDSGPDTEELVPPRLKVRWKSKKGDSDNGGYGYDFLHKAFSKYGDVSALVLSSKKKGSAIVEFTSSRAAVMAEQLELGQPSNPLTVTWLSGKPSDSAHTGAESQTTDGAPRFSSFPSAMASAADTTAATDSNSDFESLVLRRLRQAEERKRLAEAVRAEDGD